jgi:hypothetical protein
MNFFVWLQSRISPTFRAKWLHKQGMIQAKLHKHQAAMDAYTTVIEMADAPNDVRAMALYNRALVRHALTGKSADAIKDLNDVLKMTGATEQVKTEARRKLVRMDRESDRKDSNAQ